jgi:hypothetical protein
MGGNMTHIAIDYMLYRVWAAYYQAKIRLFHRRSAEPEVCIIETLFQDSVLDEQFPEGAIQVAQAVIDTGRYLFQCVTKRCEDGKLITLVKPQRRLKHTMLLEAVNAGLKGRIVKAEAIRTGREMFINGPFDRVTQSLLQLR